MATCWTKAIMSCSDIKDDDEHLEPLQALLKFPWYEILQQLPVKITH